MSSRSTKSWTSIVRDLLRLERLDLVLADTARTGPGSSRSLADLLVGDLLVGASATRLCRMRAPSPRGIREARSAARDGAVELHGHVESPKLIEPLQIALAISDRLPDCSSQFRKLARQVLGARVAAERILRAVRPAVNDTCVLFELAGLSRPRRPPVLGLVSAGSRRATAIVGPSGAGKSSCCDCSTGSPIRKAG